MVFGEVISKSSSNIELQEINITGSITNAFASCVIEQKFMNKSPSDESCAIRIDGGMDFIVYNVKVAFGSKIMNFVIREIEEAKKSISEAKRKGLGYSSVARSDETSDALVLDIGNMPANSPFTVYFETSFVGSVVDSKTLAFKLQKDKDFIDFPVSLNINVNMSDIERVEGVAFEASEHGGKIIADKKPVNEIIFHMKKPLESSAVSFTVGENSYVGVAMIPSIPAEIKPKTECIILVDCSYSMNGTSMEVAKEAQELVLHSLPYDSYFNIYRFGSDFESFFSESVPYTEENLKTAIMKTRGMNADLGGTNLLYPLKNIFQEKGKEGYIKQIFIITDGAVDNENEILTLVSKNRNSTRCFAFGIGYGVSKGFIDEFAKSTGGNPSFITDSNSVIPIIMKQLTSAIKPAVTEVQIHCERSESIEVAPFPIPPLFASQITCIFIKNAVGDILVEGKTGDEEYEETINPIESDIHIDKLFAFYNIRDLEESIPNADEEGKKSICQNVIKLSLMNGIVSQFTAMCSVVDDREKSQEPSKQTWSSKPQFSQYVNARQTRVQHEFIRSCGAVARFCDTRPDDEISQNKFIWRKWHSSNEEKESTESVPMIVRRLMKKQNFDGYWVIIDAVQICAKFNFELKCVSDKELSTVFALAILELYGNESIYLFIYNKGLDWLKSNNPSFDWKKAIDDAKEKIKIKLQ